MADVHALETCPRCGGTGVDPDPDGGSQWGSSASGSGGLADALFGALLAPLLEWIMRKTLALLFPKLHAPLSLLQGRRRCTERSSRLMFGLNVIPLLGGQVSTAIDDRAIR
jgi:hypothetical protein